MKKVLLMLFLCFCTAASAQEFNYEGIFYQILDQDAKTCTTKIGSPITPGNTVGGDVVLPANPIYAGEAYTLTEIGNFSFSNAGSEEYITNLTIPNTVTRIGQYAFSRQQMLQYVEIPSSVEFIDTYAFTHNLGVTYFKLSDGLKRLGQGVFAYCYSLQDLELPSTLETIDGFIFGGVNNDGTGGEPFYVTQLFSLSYNPPKITDGRWAASYGSVTHTTLYVPKGAKENYLNAPGWSVYGENGIEEIDRLMVFFDKKNVTMVRGANMSLIVINAYDQSNSGNMPRNIELSSSDESVVRAEFVPGVPPKVNIHAIGEGTARVTLTMYPNNVNLSPASAYCDITVREGNISFTLSENNITLKQNESKQLIVDITGLEPGTSTLTVTLENTKGEKISETCDITVLGNLTDVANLFSDPEEATVNIYTIAGVLMMQNVAPETVLSLYPGLYIVGNKKVLVR